MPAPLVAAAPAQPSVIVEAPRRRTGTPEVGVPVPELSAVAGQIEPRRSKEPSGPVEAPSRRARRASSSSGLSAPTDSSSWFDDGEQASREADRIRARKSKSPSSTDLSLYDEPAMRKRWPLLVGGLVVVGALVGTIAFAMSRGEDKKKPAETAAVTPPPPVTNVPPSEIIEPETPTPPPPAETAVATTTPAKKSTPDPAVSHVTTPKTATTTTPKTTTTTTPKTTTTTTPKTTTTTSKTTSPKTNVDPEDTAGRRPGGDWFATTPTTTTPTNTTPAVTTPAVTTPAVTTPAVTTPPPTGVSGADGPLDPYGADPATASDASGPEKKADFFANLGQQRLASNDTTGAAANFMKALEIDPKNVVSTIGMGEIALRQGLFGDAIAHLKKAVKLAPKSSRVFTLLGEAYLNSGNNSVAADNFKKALQLDPENARARDGYNEASSKVPPPTDD
jgi:hypothetical protein